jgi:hypothetical protein
MGPKTRQLVEVLDELVAALTDLGQPHWRDWMSESVRRLRADDFKGITHLLQAYGGGGSFNDFSFDGSNPRARRAEELAKLAYTLSREIQREVRSE